MTQHYTHISEGKAREIAGVIDISGDTETESTEKQLPDWVREQLEGMTAKNWKDSFCIEASCSLTICGN